jgi:hypothetical protein
MSSWNVVEEDEAHEIGDATSDIVEIAECESEAHYRWTQNLKEKNTLKFFWVTPDEIGRAGSLSLELYSALDLLHFDFIINIRFKDIYEYW